MGLFEFRKPKWRHKDPAVRLEAIESIDPGEIELLASLSSEDHDQEVRWAAINRLNDLTALDQLAEDAAPEDLPIIAARKDALLYDQIVDIDSQNNEEWNDSLAQITSPQLLAELGVNARLPAVRLAAVNRIDDQLLLTGIVKQNCGKKPAMAAMEKITDEALLADLVENAASKTARRLAADKIARFEDQRNKSDNKEMIAQRLNELAAETVQLQDRQDMDAVALRLEAIRQEWEELDKESNHPEYRTIRKVSKNFEEKYKKILDRRKISQEKTVRYEKFQAQLNEICSTIERLSCSTDNNAEDVKEEAVSDWEALVSDPNSELLPNASLAKRYTDACQAFDTNREKINHERELIKVIGKECSEVHELISSQDLKKATVRLTEIRKRVDSIEFKYFNKTRIENLVLETSIDLDYAEKEVRNRNLSKRQEICAEIEKLVQSEKPGYIEKELQGLDLDWQQLAKLDDAEGHELEQRYKKIVDELTEKVQNLQHKKDWELWANLNLKEKLTERVVALDQEADLETVVNVVKQSQVEWKKIGPVPQKESQKLWDEFHSACNRNFERAKPYLEELKTRRIEAMERRREICAFAAELAESSDWQKTTLALKGFQQEWKTLLHGSRQEEQKLYKKLRMACDRFFERRKEFYESQDEERQQNLIAKVKLCEEAEQLAAEPQIDYPGKFKRLQADWKKIGPVPREDKDAVWKRFRAACDKYFDWLAEEQQQNLKRKEELCELAEKLVAESTAEKNREEIATKLTELQQQWKEIGPVPPGQSQVVWKRFREPCDLFFTSRRQEYEKEEEQRRINQGQKEDILARMEELASRGNDKETASQLKQLQKEWSEIGPTPRDINKELNNRFQTLCDAFFEDRRQFFADLKAQQLENQKQKESLCLRLENILGLSHESVPGKHDTALSLAEELKQAMEDNFMLAGRRNEQKDISDEIKRIEQDWQMIGPVPPRQIRPLNERYKKALDAFYKSQRSQKR